MAGYTQQMLDAQYQKFKRAGYMDSDVERLVAEQMKNYEKEQIRKETEQQVLELENKSGVKLDPTTKEYLQLLGDMGNPQKISSVMKALQEDLGLSDISFGSNIPAQDDDLFVEPGIPDLDDHRRRDSIRAEVEEASKAGLLDQDDTVETASMLFGQTGGNIQPRPPSIGRNPPEEQDNQGGLSPTVIKDLKDLFTPRSNTGAGGGGVVPAAGIDEAISTGLGTPTNVAIPSTPLAANAAATKAATVASGVSSGGLGAATNASPAIATGLGTPPAAIPSTALGANPGIGSAINAAGTSSYGVSGTIGNAAAPASGVSSGGVGAAANAAPGAAAPGVAATAAGLAAGAAFVYAGKELLQSDTKSRLRRQLQENGGFTENDEFGTQIGATNSAGIMGAGIAGFTVDLFDLKAVNIGTETYAIKGLNKDTTADMLEQAKVVYNSFNQNVENTFGEIGITKDVSAQMFKKGNITQKELESIGFKGVGTYQEGKYGQGGKAMLGAISATTFSQLTNGARTGKIRTSTLQGGTPATAKEKEFLKSINLMTHEEIQETAFGGRGDK